MYPLLVIPEASFPERYAFEGKLSYPESRGVELNPGYLTSYTKA